MVQFSQTYYGTACLLTTYRWYSTVKLIMAVDGMVYVLLFAGLLTFFHGDLIIEYFLQSFSCLRCFKKGSCQFLAKECAHYWLIAERAKPAQ